MVRRRLAGKPKGFSQPRLQQLRASAGKGPIPGLLHLDAGAGISCGRWVLQAVQEATNLTLSSPPAHALEIIAELKCGRPGSLAPLAVLDIKNLFNGTLHVKGNQIAR